MSYCQRHTDRKAQCRCMALCWECRLSFSHDCGCRNKPSSPKSPKLAIDDIPKLIIEIPLTEAPPNTPDSPEPIETVELPDTIPEEHAEQCEHLEEIAQIERANNIELKNIYSVSAADIVDKLEDINKNIAIIDEVKANEALKQADDMVNKLNNKYEKRLNSVCEEYNHKLSDIETEKKRLEDELRITKEKMKSIEIIESNTKKIVEIKKKASAKKKEEKFARLSRGESALQTLLPKQRKRS